jgi:hypothetical protein
MNQWFKFIEVRAVNVPWRQSIGILISLRETGRPWMVAKELEFVEVPDGVEVNPTFHLEIDQAQGLMDCLWNCGLRPTQSGSSIGQTEAIQKHLEDMRQIVFSNLVIDKP